MRDIMKIVTSFGNSGLYIKSVTQTIENDTKEERGGLLSILLSTLGVSLWDIS